MDSRINRAIIYLTLGLKLFVTYVAWFEEATSYALGHELVPFSTIAIFFSLALAYDPRYPLHALTIFFVSSGILLMSLVTAIVGIKLRKASKVSVVLITIFMFFDFVVSFFVSPGVGMTLKIKCIVGTFITFIICFLAVKKRKKYSKKELF